MLKEDRSNMDEKRYGIIPGVKQPVSRILFGMAMKPFLSGEDGTDLLDSVLAAGINTFDLARNYNLAERSMGKWMEKRGNRDQVVLLSKCAHPSVLGRKRVSEKEIRKDFRLSSEALGTDFIDIYLLHRDDPKVPAGQIVEIMNALHAEGKIGVFGGSNWTHRRIAEANEYAYAHGLVPFTLSSPNFGLAEQIADPWGGGCVTVSGPENEDARAWYRAQEMPVIAYSSLGRGFFSGRMKSTDAARPQDFLDGPSVRGYACPRNFERLRRCEVLAGLKNVSVPQIAMRWIFGQDLNVFAVVSSSRPERIRENLQALSLEMTPAELDYLDLRRDEPA